jgi:hypothetical protein
MSHETKIGVLVSCSFVCMVGAVIYLRLHDPAALSQANDTAELPGWAQPAAPAAPTAELNIPAKANPPRAPVATGDSFRPNPIPAEIQRTTHVVPGNNTDARPPFNPPTASVPNPLLGGGEPRPAPTAPQGHETPIRPSGQDVVSGTTPPAPPLPPAPPARVPVEVPSAIETPRTTGIETPAPVDNHRPVETPPTLPSAPADALPPTSAPVIPPPPPAPSPTVGGTELVPPAAPHVPAPVVPPVEPAAPVNPSVPAPIESPVAPPPAAPPPASTNPLGGAPINPLPGSVPPVPQPAPVVPPPVDAVPTNPIPSNPIPSNPIPSNQIPSNPVGVNPVPVDPAPRAVILGSPEVPAPRPAQTPGVMPDARGSLPPAGDTMPETRTAVQPLPPVSNQVAQNVPAVNYPLPPTAGQVRQPALGAPQVVSFNEETHLCKPGDTFASICKEKYTSEKYDRALLMFNRAHPMAADGIRNDPPVLKPGAEVFIPPMNILERNYAALIPDLVPVNRPMAPVGGMPAAAAPGFAPSASRSSPGADRLYRVVEKPETLWEVAARTLGNGERWSDIFRMNPGVNSKESLPVGTVLRLPPG